MTSVPQGISPASGELAALSSLTFELRDPMTVLSAATAAIARLGPCQPEAVYRFADDTWTRLALCPDHGPGMDELITDCGGSGAIDIAGRGWGWAFPLTHHDVVEGALVVSAPERPARKHIQLLMVLANQTAAALACLTLHQHDTCAERLAEVTAELAGAQRQLHSRFHVHDKIEAALSSGEGEQAITDALHELTGLSIALEDPFGNLRCWSGLGQPEPYPKPEPQRRQRQLAVLAAGHGPLRMKDRVAILVSPRGENLGVLAIVDPRITVTADDIFALHFACTLLGYELAHQRSLVELEQNLRRELLDDLLAGTDDDGAVARAAAFGHDLRRPHHVIVVRSSAGTEAIVGAAVRAMNVMQFNALHGRKNQLVVLLAEGRPDPRALHRALSDSLNPTKCAIGVGSRCEVPSDIPQSFIEARRALSVRLHSAVPAGASAYDELGFYRLIDAAHEEGVVEDFIREWLGALLDYDSRKKSDLVFTLSEYLESGGNHVESAKVLHIHRSTLRYRLARISNLTGYDLRDIDVRFNLQAATRSWRFLHSDSVALMGSP